eukprot:2280924-Rhodomonas_salina.4
MVCTIVLRLRARGSKSVSCGHVRAGLEQTNSVCVSERNINRADPFQDQRPAENSRAFFLCCRVAQQTDGLQV